MLQKRIVLFYVLITGAALSVITWILLQAPPSINYNSSASAIPADTTLQQFITNTKTPLTTLLLQILLILCVGKTIGKLFQKIKQPAVIGEMVAGIVLGSSFLGWCFPEVYHHIFPKKSIDSLSLLSQIGLLLFMFSHYR
jgi:hypothetical protein